MTNFSIVALLLLGIAVGPYGLNLLTSRLLTLLDPAVAMAAAMLGVFVGLTIDFGRPASRMPEVLLILCGGFLVAAFREPSAAAAVGLMGSLAVISATVAIAGWLLVGQTASEGEQHVFVVGALLLMAGAATYLSLSAAFAGLLAGMTWAAAGNVAKARIVRDLHYFQHPLVVLVLVAAGAAATLTVDALMVASALLAAAAVLRPMVRRLADRRDDDDISSLVPAGLVAIALAFDAFRADARPEWAVTLLGGVVIATIASEAISTMASVRTVPT
jgi:hypothetical protein